MTLDFAKNTKLVTSLNLGLLVLLAYILVDFFWLIMLPQLDNNQVDQIITAKPITQDKMPEAKALFGKKQLRQKAVVEKKIVKSKLNLELKGVWLNNQQLQKSYAIIKISGVDKIFYLNDRISSLAKLVEININFVVLDRSGQLEALYLRKNNKDLVIDEKASASANDIVPNLNSREKSRLNKIRKDLKNNPWKLSQILNVKPSYKSGELIGFEIRPGRERNLFYKLKLEPGDVVHSINGQRLSLSTMQAALNTVVDNSDISIGFYRKKNDKTLVLNL